MTVLFVSRRSITASKDPCGIACVLCMRLKTPIYVRIVCSLLSSNSESNAISPVPLETISLNDLSFSRISSPSLSSRNDLWKFALSKHHLSFPDNPDSPPCIRRKYHEYASAWEWDRPLLSFLRHRPTQLFQYRYAKCLRAMPYMCV